MSKPDKLIVLACEVAVHAPLKRNQAAEAVRIPWSIVEEIRKELTARGVDWLKLHDQQKNRKS